MAIENALEYLAIDNLPLSTAAWDTEDIADLLNGPSVRGNDLVNPSRIGQIARRRTLDARTVTIPIVVNGYYDSNGDLNSDPRLGLISNLDELKKYLTPNFTSLTGTRTLEWVTVDDVRVAQVHVNPAISVSSIGPHAARVAVSIIIVGGVLRDEVDTTFDILLTNSENTKTETLNIPGNVEVQDARIEFTGQAGLPNADSFKISNLTYDNTGGVYVEYDDTVDDTLNIYAENYSATLGTTAVGGSIVNAGSAIWLPLLPGNNSIKIDTVNNSVASRCRLYVKGAWA